MEVSYLFSQFFDFSKVITCAVSIVLIIYGSFRAIKLEPSPKRTFRVIHPSGHKNGNGRKFTVPIITSASKVANGVGAIKTPGRGDNKGGGSSNRANLVKCPTSPACACNTRACNQRGVMTGVSVDSSGSTNEGKGSELSRKEMKKHSYPPRQKHQNGDDVTVLLLSPGSDVTSDQDKDFEYAYATQCNHSTRDHSSRDASPSSTNSGSLLSNAAGVQVLDSSQALLLPLGASFSLLFMFFFFESFQVFFAIAIASVATIAFAFLVHPLCHFILKPFISLHKVSVGILGRHLPSEILSFVISLTLVVLWLVTGHWLLMDLLSMGLCVSLIAHIRLPSLKVSSILLISLLFYDVFWVFFSSMLFSSNVMVKVATQPAENPVGLLARKLNVASVMSHAPKLSLPGKLIFPSHLSWEELGGDANVFDPADDADANINVQPHHHHHHYHHNLDSNRIGRINSENAIGRMSGSGSAPFQQMKVTKPGLHAAVAELMLSNDLGIGDSVNIGSSGASLSHAELMKAVAQQGGGMRNSNGGFRFDPSHQGVGNFMAPMGAVHMHYSMLGLGDIVIPGLLLCFVLRFDYIRGRSQNIFHKHHYPTKKKQCEDDDSFERENVAFNWSPLEACLELGRRITIFHTTLLGYLLGLAVATVSSEVFEKAQPALLYIVPSTLIPLVITALLKGELQAMWSDPFPSETSPLEEDDSCGTKRLSISTDTANERIDSYPPFNSNFRSAPKMHSEGNDDALNMLGNLAKGGESTNANVRGCANVVGRSKNANTVNISSWHNQLDNGAVETFNNHLTPIRNSSSSLEIKTHTLKDPAIAGAALNPKFMSTRLSESTRGGLKTAVSMPLAVQID